MIEDVARSGRHQTLAAAQQLLLARRAALRQHREQAGAALANGDPARSPQPGIKAILEPAGRSLVETLDRLPDHLGWGSATATAVIRATLRRHSSRGTTPSSECPAAPLLETPAAPAAMVRDTVALAPSLGLAMLRQKEAANGRLWLLLRALDASGRGAVPLAEARAAFCAEGSPLRFCSRRRLRMILAAGEGRYWATDGERIWLRSTARVARELGVTRFHHRAVAVPVAALTGGIGGVRAHLYAALHSGRSAAPISRRSLQQQSGVAPRTQRQYDRRCRVRVRRNYACGAPLESDQAQEQAWEQGPASFAWHEGRRTGRRDTPSLAWQLPNSYEGPHARLGRGQQKRQNKALADLMPKGTTGNGQALRSEFCRLYFPHARAAAQQFGRSARTLYWPAPRPGIWFCLWQPGQGGRLPRGGSAA